MKPEDLKDVILRIRNRDQAAFKTLVTMYQQTAFRISFRILCEEEEARESVQDGFIRVWEKIGTYDPAKNFTTWILRIFTNSAVDRLRSRKRRNLVRLARDSEMIESSRLESPDAVLDNKETGRLIRLIADGLPEKQQMVFILRDIEGLGSVEVQQILDMTETSVKSNLWHARKSVRDKLIAIFSYERAGR